MTDVEKVLARIGTARDAISRKREQTSLDYMIEGVLMECAVLLKEQGAEIRQLKLALDIAKGTCKGIKVRRVGEVE